MICLKRDVEQRKDEKGEEDVRYLTSGSRSPSADVSSPPPVPQCWPVSGGSGGSSLAEGTSLNEEKCHV